MQALRAQEAELLVDSQRGNIVDFGFESDLKTFRQISIFSVIFKLLLEKAECSELLTSSAFAAIIFSTAMWTNLEAIPCLR